MGMQYVVEDDRLFKEKMEKYERSWPRMKEFRRGLHDVICCCYIMLVESA